jgi:hypothetical protein
MTGCKACHHHQASKGTGDHDPNFCATLHSITPVSTGVTLIAPDFGFAWLGFNSAAQTVSTVRETAIRQSPERVWVFLPEVCLGAALRSQAPPVFLLS